MNSYTRVEIRKCPPAVSEDSPLVMADHAVLVSVQQRQQLVEDAGFILHSLMLVRLIHEAVRPLHLVALPKPVGIVVV